LFLANSYDQLRDPNRINLRYETPAEAEYLVANLLAPSAAGTLSRPTSQHEFYKLFERDRFGLDSSTEYLSRGAWTENGAQYGIFGSSAYSVEAFYHTDPGQHRNGDFEETILDAKFKQQLTVQDSLFLQATYYDASGGDRFEYYDPTLAFPQGPNPGVRTKEKQEPFLSLGYHHEWGPGVHTLMLGTVLRDRVSVENPSQISLLVDRIPEGLDYVEPFLISQSYESERQLYSAELQQIWQTDRHLTIVGGRYQGGDYDTRNLQMGPYGTFNVPFIVPNPETPAQQADFTVHFDRFAFYGYHYWQIAEPLLLVGGLSYDRVTFPKNYRVAPISDEEQAEDRVSPKVGLIWTPWTNSIVRAAYTRSLSGAGIDQSIQLEPTQVAGFLQSFRSIIPESVGGAQAGAHFETFSGAIEQRFPTGTYLSLQGQLLRSEVERTVGEFEFNPDPTATATTGGTRDEIKYEEWSLLFTVDQLLWNEWSVGARYRVTWTDLWDKYPEVLPVVDAQDPSLLKGFRRDQHLESMLHELNLHIVYNHPSGLFGRFEALWYEQSNAGYAEDLPSEQFWQLNTFVGYRFPRRRAELSVGVLNLTDQDYRLNPLTLYNELPRERTIAVRLQLSF
jgi:outer membrane receptor protein involved in Fe transport